MQKLVALVMLSVLASSPAFAKDKEVIAAFGDSLTAGVNVKPEDTFPVQLEQKITIDGYDVKVINDGVAGDTSADGLARIANVIFQHPTWVIIEFGTVDMKQGIPPEKIRHNLEEMIRHFKESNIKVMLAGTINHATDNKAYVEEFNAIYPALAEKYSVVLYPDFLANVWGLAALMQPDGIHPTRDGNAVIADGIAAKYEWYTKRK